MIGTAPPKTLRARFARWLAPANEAYWRAQLDKAEGVADYWKRSHDQKAQLADNFQRACESQKSDMAELLSIAHHHAPPTRRAALELKYGLPEFPT